MPLTAPTLEDLRQLDLPELIDMLAKYTAEYTEQYKNGLHEDIAAKKELLIKLQMVIDEKRSGN